MLLFLAAERVVQPPLGPLAEGQQQECQRKGGEDDRPVSGAADDPDARGKERACGAGQAVDVILVAPPDDHTGAKKADPGQHALDHAADCIGEFAGINGLQCQQHDRGGREADEAKRLQADRLAAQVAVEPDRATRQRGGAETQDDLAPVCQGVLCFYFGCRPSM
ncbi:hypothetical protein AC628_26460 [Bradyrhizobium sp. NAS96.2]|nr:hypothetical protein AC628_26460 [Bradyrhizobium sp. NAS96.2]